MSFDAHKNLAIATVTTATGAAGTTLGVGAGEGARFPAVPFNATVWPFDMAPDPTTAEVVRVTARAGDSLTITRAQEGTTARAIVVGDMVAATITAKTITDIESGVNFPLIAVPADLVLTTDGVIRRNTTDGADTGYLHLQGGGGSGNSRGAYVSVTGNDLPAGGGRVQIVAGDSSATNGQINFFTGPTAMRGTMHPSGGFSWGGTTDPGAGNLSVNGNLHLLGGTPKILIPTADGADNAYLSFCGGGDLAPTRGAYCVMGGNESAFAGTILFAAGDVAGAGTIDFYTAGAGLPRGRIHRSGGFSWGGTTDPGAVTLHVGTGGTAMGIGWVNINGPLGSVGMAAPAITGTVAAFYSASGAAGRIDVNGTACTYVATSDARLKTPLSRHTDTEVLRRTVIHDFVWKSDGTKGRGVFAQEAQFVAPFAVSVGRDEVDDEGRLTHPWGVDYSKYVPDLIAGWQAHEARGDALFKLHMALASRVTAVEAATIGTSTPPPSVFTARPSWRRRLVHRIRTALFAWKPSWV